MGHHHHHGHDHSHAPQTFNTAFAVSIALNLIYTLIQAGFAFYAHSMSLLADAGHNLGDVLALLLAWGAAWLLTRSVTERHSYGYKRTTILTALFNALVLMAICLFLLVESFDRLGNPHAIREWVVVIVALMGVLINTGTALLFLRGSKEDLNLRGAFLHLASDALVSLGVVIGAIIIYFTHWLWLDPVIGILIALFIIYGTWGLLTDSVNLILDGVPRGVDIKKVKAYLENLSGVDAVHDLHIWGLSTRETALTAHLVMPNSHLSDADYPVIRHYLKEHFNIGHITLQTEKGNDEHPCENECDH